MTLIPLSSARSSTEEMAEESALTRIAPNAIGVTAKEVSPKSLVCIASKGINHPDVWHLDYAFHSRHSCTSCESLPSTDTHLIPVTIHGIRLPGWVSSRR